MKAVNVVNAKTAATFLNEVLSLDADAINTLMSTTVEVNSALSDHSTVQVNESGDKFHLGLLGLLNGLFGVDERGFGYLYAVVDSNRVIQKFGSTYTEPEESPTTNAGLMEALIETTGEYKTASGLLDELGVEATTENRKIVINWLIKQSLQVLLKDR